MQTMSNVIKFDFNGSLYSFDVQGWFNATEAAARFGRRPVDWLRQDEVRAYVAAMAEALGQESKVGQDHFGLVRAVRGGNSPGTWMHPKLAVRFAQWLDVRFAVWCDLQIDAIVRNGIRVEGNAKLMALFLRPNAEAWERRFGPDYYQALAKVTRTTYTGHAGGTPAQYGHITDRWVYGCLLPADVHAELKARRGASQKMHQWLTDGGQDLLDRQIATVRDIASTSADMRDFEARMMAVSRRQGQLGFVYPVAA